MAGNQQTIIDAMQAAKSVTTDGLNVQQHSLQDLLAADRYLCQQEAALAGKRPFKVSQCVLPGTQQLQNLG